MNTKRVPIRPDANQLRVMRETAEVFEYELTPKLEQFLTSVYAGMVTAAPEDPAEKWLEQRWEEAHGRAAA